MSTAQKYWEHVHEKFEPHYVSEDNASCSFLNIIANEDNLKGKKVLEIGCGNGLISIFLAKKGANVTAIDNTENAICNVKIMADFNNVTVKAIKMDAMEIDKLKDKYDYIVGRFVLHHIEPFEEFVAKLSSILNFSTGKGLFYENSDANKLLMLCRSTLVGKFGIPRFGDGVEIPFQKHEIDMLKKNFHFVHIVYPEMKFWRLLGQYIFRKNKKLKSFFEKLDKAFYKYLPYFNRYSYEQIIYFHN
ncbi:MAG: class I SAM-dependent methyltransferase [Synergistaceae bacterium]|jgi:cyclopropane fatty-acyl-phospholipid synthase-like methyltransferase|nr:class I SAM-dependent methyltransferase [Synergistaceae bacterium]